MRWAALVTLAVLGCGGADTRDPLDGTKWALESSAYCATGLRFADGAYDDLFLCTLNDGSVGLQVASGNYDVVRDEIRLNLTRGSCGWAPQSSVFSWQINSGGGLVIQDAAGVSVYQPAPSSGSTFIGTYGCFSRDANQDLIFSAQPVHAL